MSEQLLSYSELIKARDNFRKVDRDGFNRFESPLNLYFRVMFNFTDSYGLLGLNGMSFDSVSETEQQLRNATYDTIKNVVVRDTALHFLTLNYEYERVTYLKQFIQLLSKLSSECPWYFKEISGLDAALQRSEMMNEIKIDDKRKSITIKCIGDAYDTRIGTLLDLYRSIVWSHSMKRVVVPSNLRRFNMGILLFNSYTVFPNNVSNGVSNDAAGIPSYDTTRNVASAKLIELKNCEIEMDSSTTALSAFNNEEPVTPEYTITISFDDAYESRFNELTSTVIGDVITADLDGKTKDSDVSVNTSNRFITNTLLSQISQTAESKATQVLSQLYMGNLSGVSISKARDIADKALSGDVIGAVITGVNTAVEAVSNLTGRKLGVVNSNITTLGKITRAMSLANNI